PPAASPHTDEPVFPAAFMPISGDTHPAAAPPGLLLEVAWEVCNQVGGIFQVLRSKVPCMVERWGERYCLIGPWEPAKAALEFEETTPTGVIGRAVTALRNEGLIVHHGRWMVTGRPRVLLIEHWQGIGRLDAAKYRLWADHKLSVPSGDGLIDGVVSFADAVRRLIERIVEHARVGSPDAQQTWTTDEAGGAGGGPGRRPGPIVAHFHEWMGGLAIPMIRQQQLPVGLVFQTHATLLGRYMASADDRFYDRLAGAWGGIDQAAAAAAYNIPFQHGVERACAHGSHVFTTVSQITGEECAGLLGRRPDVILPNGLDIQRYNVGHEFQTMHAENKERIHRFVMGHFFPSYPMDLDKTVYMFTSGRFEPKNKGFDLCLEAMARLNGELRARGSPLNVVFFIITQRPTRSLHPWALQQRGVLNEFRWVTEQIMKEIGEKVFRTGATGQRVKLDDLVSEYWTLRYRRTQQALKVDRLPLVTTHTIENEAADPVIAQIRNVWLFNRKDDPVKVVYHPDFISPTNPLWGMEYDQFVRGCHVGVFPSAYEPWGYTPLECMAMGVPAVSSDLAGFGSYVAQKYGDHNRPGAWIVHRRGRSFQDAAGELTRYLMEFCRLDRRGRIALRNQVEAQSWEFDWSVLGEAYVRAHDLTLNRAFGVPIPG
ncbi:MAG: glycosyltransferase, partial [Phycisphaerales bacterium]